MAPGGKGENKAYSVSSCSNTLNGLVRPTLGVLSDDVDGGSMSAQDGDIAARDGCEGVPPNGSGEEGVVGGGISERVPHGGSSAAVDSLTQVGVAVQQVLLLHYSFLEVKDRSVQPPLFKPKMAVFGIDVQMKQVDSTGSRRCSLR